ncbi:MAG TPA: F-box protein [Rhabdochlamydiaceae bacterium]|nr:F-box protein [Rhabdochlamydiaceae bacterium]
MPTNSIVSYGPFGPFASPVVRPLRNDEFSHVLSFLKPEELALAERVCATWKHFIKETDQWKKQCQFLLNIPINTDPMDYVPDCSSYKEILQLVLPKIFGEETYQYYLGAEVGPVPRIPKEIAPWKWNEPDPCDPTKLIGEQYDWMYVSKYLEITVDGNSPYYLDKLDDPNDEEAPRLIQKEVESGTQSEEKRVLKVPNTIHNIVELFKNPKKGNPSAYFCVGEEISNQHGNKRIQPGWICMRKDVIGRGQYQSFSEQQETAKKAGVVIPQLLHRILYNFLKHLETDYPDGKKPLTRARTSTLTLDSRGITYPSDCGCGLNSPSELRVRNSTISIGSTGAAVALPMKDETIDR